jgi:hypothetical protein
MVSPGFQQVYRGPKIAVWHRNLNEKNRAMQVALLAALWLSRNPSAADRRIFSAT